MDIFTHAFSGLVLSRLRKKAGKKLLFVFVVAAILPDIDSFFMFFSSELKGHRLITHSLIAVPFLALITALFFYFIFKRKIHFLLLYIIGIVGLLAHLFLDCLLVWGCPLFYPFSGHYYSFDLYLTVIDPYIWILYIVFILAFLFYKLGFFSFNIRLWIKYSVLLILVIFMGRFLLSIQAKNITTLDHPLVVPVNETAGSFFLQRHWKAVSRSEYNFRYQIIDVFSGEILNEGVRDVYSGAINCPLFTKEYLFSDDGKVGDIRFTHNLNTDMGMGENCIYGLDIQ